MVEYVYAVAQGTQTALGCKHAGTTWAEGEAAAVDVEVEEQRCHVVVNLEDYL